LSYYPYILIYKLYTVEIVVEIVVVIAMFIINSRANSTALV